jgi:hypothetical protein
MKPTTKKWLATSFEIGLVVAFAGFGFLASDEVRKWYRSGLLARPPKEVWLWSFIGILLGVSRYLTSRYSRQEALGILSTSSFAEGYRETLESSMSTLVSVLRNPQNQRQLLDTAETEILKAIATVVDYFRNATASKQASINCVLMEPKPYDPATYPSGEILGLEPSGEQYLKSVLVITKMAREEIEIPLLRLPVYDLGSDFRDKNPFGAPRTFVTREKQIINCTLWLIPHRGRSSRKVMVELWRHFWRLRGQFLSFASLPVTSNNRVVAVINVHCGSLRVLGKNPTMLVDFLIPFLTILSYIYDVKGVSSATL